MRLVGALLLEQNDEWQLQRRYLSLEGLGAISDNQNQRLSAVITVEPQPASRVTRTPLRGTRSGDCYDNAMCESFNAILECELLVKHRFKTPREASLAVFDFIEGFYNPRRRHTSIGSISPMEFERRTHAA